MVLMIKFKDKESYRQWLEEQPDEVKMIAREYHKSSKNVPIVLVFCGGSLYSLRCEYRYIFVDPKILKTI